MAHLKSAPRRLLSLLFAPQLYFAVVLALLLFPAEVATAQACPIKVLGGVGQTQNGLPAQPTASPPLTMADHIRNLMPASFSQQPGSAADANPFAKVQALKLAPGSRIWLDGSSNVVDFTCEVKEMYIYGELAPMLAPAASPTGSTTGHPSRSPSSPNVGENPPHGAVSLRLRIPVDQLDCGQRGINKDMMTTLNASRFPYIEYSLGPNRLIQSHDLEDRFFMDIETTGNLTISGNTRSERIEVEGEFLGPWQFRIRGCHGVEMPDYGLTPPSPMFGLIKVNDRLVVNFDVTLMLDL